MTRTPPTFDSLSETLHGRQKGTMGVGELTCTRGAESWSYSLAIPEIPETVNESEGVVISEVRQSWLIRPADVSGDWFYPRDGDVLTFASRTYAVPADAGEDYDPIGASVRVRGVLQR